MRSFIYQQYDTEPGHINGSAAKWNAIAMYLFFKPTFKWISHHVKTADSSCAVKPWFQEGSKKQKMRWKRKRNSSNSHKVWNLHKNIEWPLNTELIQSYLPPGQVNVCAGQLDNVTSKELKGLAEAHGGRRQTIILLTHFHLWTCCKWRRNRGDDIMFERTLYRNRFHVQKCKKIFTDLS